MKYLIIGAGPSGLSFANRLLQQGEGDFLVLEQEASAGGLCRSADIGGAPLDIGGGHFLDVRRPAVLDFVFAFMPRDEWDSYDRISKISIHGQMIGSPIESYIWQLSEALQAEYLKDIAEAGCNTGREQPARFVDWIYWKLGRRIAEDYMLPYNRKMFGENLDQLGTYWLEKLPNVSYEDTLRSCREKRFCGSQPGHAQFFYPKHHGYGEVWKRMAEKLGTKLKFGAPVRSLNCRTRVVNETYTAEVIVNTAPWTSFELLEGLSEASQAAVSSLRHSAVAIDYFPERLPTDAQWIYYPDAALSYHRILVRHNFCPDSSGYWTETNASRVLPHEKDRFRHVNPYAYPLNTIGKNERMKALLSELSDHSIIGLGRWGEWQHDNSDVVVDKALRLADAMMKQD